jgi:hypothetical protein
MDQVWTAAAIDECYTQKGKGQKVIFFGVGLDGDERDLKISKVRYLGKEKVPEPYITDALKDRRYSFSQFHPGRLEGIPNEQKMALILGSLFLGEPVGAPLKIYIDGLHPQGAKNYIKVVLRRITGLEKSLIQVHDGAQLDERMPLANLAHQCARVFSDSSRLTFGSPPGKKHLAIRELSGVLNLKPEVIDKILNDPVFF